MYFHLVFRGCSIIFFYFLQLYMQILSHPTDIFFNLMIRYHYPSRELKRGFHSIAQQQKKAIGQEFSIFSQVFNFAMRISQSHFILEKSHYSCGYTLLSTQSNLAHATQVGCRYCLHDFFMASKFDLFQQLRRSSVLVLGLNRDSMSDSQSQLWYANNFAW